jgi:hypothetical protein
MEIATNILKEALTITSFVIIMLLLIEYLNIRTRGKWFSKLKGSGTRQVILGALLGLLPGCLGGYAVVSLYTHHVIGFGGLLAAFIATLGDETFVMLSIMPVTTLYIMGGLFAGGIIAGLIANKFFPRKIHSKPGHFEVHEHDHCTHTVAEQSSIKTNLRHPSFQRSLLIFGLLLFIVFMITGIAGHNHDHLQVHDHAHGTEEVCTHDHHSHNGEFQFFLIEEWLQYSFIVLALLSLLIIVKVPEHFLNEHLWKHIIKKHFLRIFIWITVSIAAIQGLLHYVHFEGLMGSDMFYWTFVLAALLIGIIPQSGPHIIFVSLFSQGIIPISILLINGIVHEGHAALPLLAESKKSFFIVKAIKIVIALLVAILGYFLRF